MTEVPEQVYADAAKALTAKGIEVGELTQVDGERWDDLSNDLSFRAAVESAFAAGRRAGREEAARAIEEHAEAIGWYEGGGVWADAIEIGRSDRG